MLQRPEFNTAADIQLWLNSKDPNERFDWSNGDTCACAQYMKERSRGAWRYRDVQWLGPIGELNSCLGKLATKLNPGARGGNAQLWVTFGQAAEEWDRYCRFFDPRPVKTTKPRRQRQLNERSMTEALIALRRSIEDNEFRRLFADDELRELRGHNERTVTELEPVAG